MSTLDGAIMRVLSDGKHLRIEDVRSRIRITKELEEWHEVPKSTLWHHLLKLQKDGKIRSYHDGCNTNRVLYHNPNVTPNLYVRYPNVP